VTALAQGSMVWTDTRAVRWFPLCAECGEPVRGEAHRHLRADIEVILAELARRAAPLQARREPVGPREHLTLRQLAEYSGWSERWLRGRTKDPVDPLPCAKRTGKLMFRRSEYDRWIARQRRREPLAAMVGDVISRLGRP
jgi:hypothetical protein